ncbi:MAG TPA: MBL fold metallo-hydrolase [Pyrinomonadaceae bacterium]|nr:MBL fold metallo-hydrolase [Pyrinomonadaceae bacterium]
MSTQELYRLNASAVAEPLVNKWPAWSHLVSPLPASLHLRHYQKPIIESFLADPQTHAAACSDPKLRSGPFVDLSPERAAEVRAFQAATDARLAPNLELADDVVAFHNLLVAEARGQSLDSFYAELPPSLRGYVELVYDYYNRPTVRVMEGLLYESPYYHAELQSFLLFRQEQDDSRAFIMSTPRLASASGLEWTMPFASPVADELFKLDLRPQPLGHVRELLGLGAADEARLRPLLTNAARQPYTAWEGASPRIRHLGHACVLIEWQGTTILTDPYIGVVPHVGGVERWSYEDLPEKIDYVLITHNHHDHFCLETLLRLRHRIGCLVVPRSFGMAYGDMSLRLMSRKLGFRNVVELDVLDSLEVPGGEIVAVPFMGEHADLPHGKTAYVVRAGDERMLFAADSDCLDPHMYEHLRRALGDIQTVFLGMECVGAPLSWSCGPFFPSKPDPEHERTRRYKGSDSERGMNILAAVGAQRLFIYAMGMEPWFEHLLGLAYTPDAKQLSEARRLIEGAREIGFAEAELLSGKRELHLRGLSPGFRVSYPSAAAPPTSGEDEEQFVFD